MTEALEPCPCCKSSAEIYTVSGGFYHNIHCPNCHMNSSFHSTKAKAVEVWNTRARAVPEGWQLVPLEPTHEMLDDAIWAAAEKITIEDGVAMFGFDAARAVYAANLAAAPKPKGQRQ